MDSVCCCNLEETRPRGARLGSDGAWRCSFQDESAGWIVNGAGMGPRSAGRTLWGTLAVQGSFAVAAEILADSRLGLGHIVGCTTKPPRTNARTPSRMGILQCEGAPLPAVARASRVRAGWGQISLTSPDHR